MKGRGLWWAVLLWGLTVVLCGAGVARGEGEGAGLSLTTGLKTDRAYRPVMVVVSNSPEARRSINFADADVVYEAILAAPGYTRYAAIYNDVHPDEVGSVRSARPYHAVLRDAWDCPFVFSNSTSNFEYSIFEYFKETGLPRTFVHSSVLHGYHFSFVRKNDDGLKSPHNLFIRMQSLVENYWPTDPDDPGKPYEPRGPGLLFSQTPSRGDKVATKVDIYYDKQNYYVNYEYDAEAGMYNRAYAGFTMDRWGPYGPVMVSNIIVQWAEHSYEENVPQRPVIELVGKGPADIYIEGTLIRGFWERKSVDAPTEYYRYADGQAEQVLLKPGKTFVQLFPLGGEVKTDVDAPGHRVYTLEKAK